MGNFVTVFTAEEMPQFDPDQVTPGVIGFAAIGLLAIAVIFLALDMNRRIRRIQFREEVREQIALEIAERDGAAIEVDPEATDVDPATAEAAQAAADEAAADEAAADQDQPGGAER